MKTHRILLKNQISVWHIYIYQAQCSWWKDIGQVCRMSPISIHLALSLSLSIYIVEVNPTMTLQLQQPMQKELGEYYSQQICLTSERLKLSLLCSHNMLRQYKVMFYLDRVKTIWLVLFYTLWGIHLIRDPESIATNVQWHQLSVLSILAPYIIFFKHSILIVLTDGRGKTNL